MSSKGTDVAIHIAEEATPNTLPATPKFFVVSRTSDSLNETTTTTESETIVDSRFEQGSSATGGEAGGTINFELSAGTQDIFFEGVSGNVFVVDQSNIGTLEIGGPELKTYTIVKHDKKLGLIEVFSGCRIGELSITGDAEGKITGSITVNATGYDDKLTATPVTNVQPEPNTKFMSAINVDAFKVNGISTVGNACAESFTITINNNLTAKPCLGSGSLIPNRYSEGKVSIGLSATVVLTQTSKVWRENVKSRDTMTAEIGIEDKAGNSYGFNFTQLELNGAEKSETNQTDEHTLALEFKHIKSAPTITRILV